MMYKDMITFLILINIESIYGKSDNPIYNETPIDEFDNNLGDFKDARIFMTSNIKRF